MHMTSYNPQIKACVAINGGTYYGFGSYTYKGAPINEHVHGDWEKIQTTEDVMNLFELLQSIGDTADLIPIHLARQAKLLLIHGADDKNICPSSGLQTARRMHDAGNGNNCTLKVYPDAGHLLEPPYMPLCRVSYHHMFSAVVVYGGERRLHADAQTDMWRSILQLFKDTFHVEYERVGRIPLSKM